METWNQLPQRCHLEFEKKPKKCQKRPQIFILVCPAPFIWSDCGKPCDETCDDPAPACFGKCVPGCRCAAGYVFHDGDCIKPERCPSYVKPEKKKNPFKCIDWWNKIVCDLFFAFLQICLLAFENLDFFNSKSEHFHPVFIRKWLFLLKMTTTKTLFIFFTIFHDSVLAKSQPLPPVDSFSLRLDIILKVSHNAIEIGIRWLTLSL